MKRLFATLALLALAPAAQAQSYGQVACAAANACVAKTSGGSLLDGYVTPSSTAGWLFVFNSTTAPADGAVTAGSASGDYQDCVYVAANNSQGISVAGTPPEPFSVGVTLVFSSTGCATLTKATALFLKARTQ